MTDLAPVIAVLTADADDIDTLVHDLSDADWATPTPAPGWTVAHQIGHLSFIFRIAGLAAGQPEAFRALAAGIGDGFDAAVNRAAAEYVALPPADLLARWRAERDAGIAALAAAPPEQPVPWLVNPLPPVVLAAAGMMEMAGHGQDIADALGVTRRPTDRIRPVTEFIVRTRDFGYLARGLEPPAAKFRFTLTAPSGATWTFGPDDATERITGPAADLSLLATRRRHRDDLGLRAEGAEADRWLDIAQAYRGPAGAGRSPRQFASAGTGRS